MNNNPIGDPGIQQNKYTWSQGLANLDNHDIFKELKKIQEQDNNDMLFYESMIPISDTSSREIDLQHQVNTLTASLSGLEKTNKDLKGALEIAAKDNAQLNSHLEETKECSEIVIKQNAEYDRQLKQTREELKQANMALEFEMDVRLAVKKMIRKELSSVYPKIPLVEADVLALVRVLIRENQEVKREQRKNDI